MSARSFRRAREREVERQSKREQRLSGRSKAAIAAGAGLSATALFAPAADAATFTVTNLNDSGAGSLREAVLDANAAGTDDTVVFQSGLSGTITLTTGEIKVDDPLTIQGPGPGTLAVSGNDASRIFYAVTAESLNVSGLTLRDGSDPGFGGAIYVGTGGDTALTVSNAAFVSNEANRGGAITSFPYDVTVTNSTFTDNTATDSGGALYTADDVTVANSTFTGNEAGAGGEGGAIYHDGGTLSITGSTLTGNTARRGGAVYVDDTDGNAPVEVSISDSTLRGNEAVTNDGGAIYVSSADGGIELKRLTIANNTAGDDAGGVSLAQQTGNVGGTTISQSTFSGNTSNDAAGGLWLLNPYGPVTIENSTFHGNSADYGGGISNYNTYDAAVTLRNSTVTGNNASDNTLAGGGIYRYGFDDASYDGDDSMTISSSIVAQNTSAGAGPDLGEGQSNLPVDGVFNVGFSLIGSTAGATITESPAGSNLTGVDPQLGPLANNGGPTETRLPALTSPAIDAGVANGLANDQRGLARTAELSATANRAGSDGTDIGSVEIQAAACQGASVPSKTGTDAGETIDGTDGPDAISAGGGDDTVNALGGKDCASGGAGKDNVNGGGGKDQLKGEDGNDRLDGAGGKDQAVGGAGKDTVKGGKGKDKLKGNAGKDKLKAADGKKDKVNCGGGKDKATVDKKDKVAKNCETVKVKR